MGRWWTTVRARTTLLASAATGITLAIGSVVLVLTLESQLTKSGDTLSQARLRDLLSAAEAGELPSSLDNVDDESLAQVIDDRGLVLASSENVSGRSAIIDTDPATELTVRTIDGPDDDETERYRVWIGQGVSPTGPVTVIVGSSLESVQEATRTLRSSLLLGVPVVMVLLGGAIWVFVGRALHRIDRITTAVDSITESEQGRVPVPPVDDEVGRLAETMNRMLDRLEASSVRQRVFVADASHDLQSPLAALRAQLEVALAHPDRADVSTLARELLADSTEMERLVRDLLYLTLQDDHRQPPDLMLLDFDDIVLEEVTRLVGAAVGVCVDTSGVSAAPVLGDSTELRRLVRNVLDNAVRHAATRVRVALSTQSSGVLLDVVDDGPGVPEEDRERVFDRFYRGDASRSRGAGSGLGLAIAAGIAGRHGGALRLLDSDTGAHFQFQLPSVPQ